MKKKKFKYNIGQVVTVRFICANPIPGSVEDLPGFWGPITNRTIIKGIPHYQIASDSNRAWWPEVTVFDVFDVEAMYEKESKDDLYP